MPSLLPDKFIFTQSNLQAYLNCKARFYLRYVERFLWPAPALEDVQAFERDRLAGSRFHQLVHQYLLGLSAETLSRNSSNDPDPRIKQWFELFTHTVSKDLSGQLWPEHTLTTQLDGFILSAKYDLLHEKDQVLTIYDWKTSRKKPSKAWLAAQLQSKVFPLVLAQEIDTQTRAEKAVIRMVYWEVTEPTNPIVFEYGSSKEEQDLELITAIMREIQSSPAADFVRTDDIQRCRYCVYRTYCNRLPETAALEDYLSDTYLALEDELELLNTD